MQVHMVHIGKTGGVGLEHILLSKKDEIKANGFSLHFHPHKFSLADVTHGKAVFFVRHPVARFVSGFNSRLRMGRPARDIPWSEGEKIAFRMFQEPNVLAETLDSSDDWHRAAAEFSMLAIQHVKNRFRQWVRNTDFIQKSSNTILYIGTQETYEDDCRALLRKLGASDQLPDLNAAERHATPPGFSTHLSDRAVANLTKWYEKDIEIYEWCRTHRDEINRQPVGPNRTTS